MPNYTEGLSVITPTGGRPEALALCEKFVRRQTWDGPLQWIVVDDVGDANVRGAEIVEVEPRWRAGQNTLARNLLAGLSRVVHGKVLIVEDDDWLGPNHFVDVAKRLETSDATGSMVSLYYHAPSRCYRIMRNETSASLGQTGFRASSIPLLEHVCRTRSMFIDHHFWQKVERKDLMTVATRDHVGMKGLPGRPGIGVGHRPDNHPDWRWDRSLGILRNWMNGDHALYEKFLGGS